MVRPSIVSLCISFVLFGCGGGAASSESHPVSASVAKAPAKPRCPPDVDSQPSDARARMSDLEAPLRKCFALGTAGKFGVSILELEITIAESGAVKDVRVRAEGAQPAAAECAQKEARKAKFAKFCGEDADIHWTYTLQ